MEQKQRSADEEHLGKLDNVISRNIAAEAARTTTEDLDEIVKNRNRTGRRGRPAPSLARPRLDGRRELDAASLPYPHNIQIPATERPKASIGDRISGLWAIAKQLIPEAIRMAETFRSVKGSGRKDFVVHQVVRAAKAAEAKGDLLPAGIEQALFGVLEIALRFWVVDRIFAELEHAGEVNVHRIRRPAPPVLSGITGGEGVEL